MSARDNLRDCFLSDSRSRFEAAADAYRAEVLREGAVAIETKQTESEAEELKRFSFLDHETELQGAAVRASAELLRRMATLTQRQVEDPHESPLHHDYALSRDLPVIPHQTTGRCLRCTGTFEDCTCGGTQ